MWFFVDMCWIYSKIDGAAISEHGKATLEIQVPSQENVSEHFLKFKAFFGTLEVFLPIQP